MIRLTHQFDDPRARATVASPTVGGCCCCCCCCIVTSLGACALTARAVGSAIDARAASSLQQPLSETVVTPEAHFREPAAREVPRAPEGGPDKLPWMIFGFFLPVLPWIVLAFGFSALSGLGWQLRSKLEFVPVLLAIATYLGLGGLFFKRTGLSGLYLVLMPVVWAVISFGEAWIWLASMRH